MNPPQSSTQNPNIASSSVQQVNPGMNQQMGVLNPQQMCNNNIPNLPQSCFMNFPNQPFAMGQFQTCVGGFPPLQNFNPSQQQQQHGQFFPHNSMNPMPFNQNITQQLGVQNLLQNVCQLLQMQNTQFVPSNFPVFPNQIAHGMGSQDLSFLVNKQFGFGSSNGPMQHVNASNQFPNAGQPLQGNSFSVQTPQAQNARPNLANFQNPMVQGIGPQELSLLVNRTFGFGNSNGPVQHGNTGQQLQGSSSFPHSSSGLVQPQQTQNPRPNFGNFQNQMAHGMGPQNLSFLVNQPFGFGNSNGPMQHVNQEQQRFVSQTMDINTGQQPQGNSFLPNASGSLQTQEAPKPPPTLTNFQENHGNKPANVNAKKTESQHKNFTMHNKNNISHNGLKSQFHNTKHAKGKFGRHDHNKNKGFNGDATANTGFPKSTKQIHSQKKVPSLNYTEQEIKQWREARKKHFPSKANMEKKLTEKQTSDEEAKLRREQLKEILAKQAELGCEVADISLPHLSEQTTRGKKHEKEWHKKGKFHDKRRRPHQVDRFAKKKRPLHQDSPNANDNTTQPKLNKREPSLLQKLLTRDIMRDKSHLLQIFRFMAVNSFFTGEPDEPLRFPSVIVRETVDEAKETRGDGKAVEMLEGDGDAEKGNGEGMLEKIEEEEGEITD